jgi:hypothetical protein
MGEIMNEIQQIFNSWVNSNIMACEMAEELGNEIATALRQFIPGVTYTVGDYDSGCEYIEIYIDKKNRYEYDEEMVWVGDILRKYFDTRSYNVFLDVYIAVDPDLAEEIEVFFDGFVGL